MRYSKNARKLFFIFIFFLYILLFVEIELRILGYLYSKKPPSKMVAAKQNFNILCLGDSFTYGIGVERGSSYPEQLEEKLTSSNLDRHFKVFNLSVPGSNSTQLVKYLERIISKYGKPDLVIVLTGANDSWNLADTNINKFINGRNALSSLNIKLKIFFAEFRIYKMLKMVLINLEGESPLFEQITKYKNIEEGALQDLVKYNLIQIITYTKSNNIKLILQNYPWGDVYGNSIQSVAEKYSIPFLDNYSAFQAKLKTTSVNNIFLYDRSHPNASGYTIMATGLYDIIAKNILE